jgi:hypothetical protein
MDGAAEAQCRAALCSAVLCGAVAELWLLDAGLDGLCRASRADAASDSVDARARTISSSLDFHSLLHPCTLLFRSAIHPQRPRTEGLLCLCFCSSRGLYKPGKPD